MGKWTGIRGEELLLSSSEHIEPYNESEVEYIQKRKNQENGLSRKVCRTSGHKPNFPTCRVLKEYEPK